MQQSNTESREDQRYSVHRSPHLIIRCMLLRSYYISCVLSRSQSRYHNGLMEHSPLVLLHVHVPKQHVSMHLQLAQLSNASMPHPPPRPSSISQLLMYREHAARSLLCYADQCHATPSKTEKAVQQWEGVGKEKHAAEKKLHVDGHVARRASQ